MKNLSEPPRADNHKIFNRIALRYDLFNTVASWRLDKYWRGKLANKLNGQKNLQLLDIATGTAELLLTILKSDCEISSAIGVDMSAEMMDVGASKIARQNLADKVTFKQVDAADMPFADSSFDVATCVFGVRNFNNPSAGLKQMFRVLKPAGRVLILEFSLPGNRIFKWGYGLYLRYAIPLIGRIITGDKHAYKYLSRTVETFVYGDGFCKMMFAAGFANVRAEPLSFGITTLYSAEKPL
ncbi:MAG TPA: bifunctional demethylmenaquinone methyltransferase/2-methoxy-6-polyprenyl-1,4-benzoquinol methylase [Phycisphaerales bacterium]|nr:bifunctional demethylmenaquinone methyltransferase/2-methoxy-6-polyprenyl-1,4-benzoquinol methylase [Phycisphaerales bacterium]HBR20380.1 bifunctional demethylmenaquinone methyltransferase/2-methoxy-6-polyprenyl-1,4-benzoquinol methylase [Phycisphaerales bacterium]